jgi:hypothetical protein
VGWLPFQQEADDLVHGFGGDELLVIEHECEGHISGGDVVD